LTIIYIKDKINFLIFYFILFTIIKYNTEIVIISYTSLLNINLFLSFFMFFFIFLLFLSFLLRDNTEALPQQYLLYLSSIYCGWNSIYHNEVRKLEFNLQNYLVSEWVINSVYVRYEKLINFVGRYFWFSIEVNR
jgi:hypothetical protein